MTVKEIHILIDLYLQEINSNVYGNVLDEEKDHFFNLEMVQYIRNVMNLESSKSQVGFEHTKGRYNSIRQLKRTVDLPVYKDTGNFVYTLLPSDYFRIINSASKIVTFCNPAITDEGSTNRHYVLFELREIISDIDSTSPDAISDEFYRGFKLELSDADQIVDFTFNLDDYYPLGFEDEGLRYILLHLLFEEINKSGIYKCYWNFYNGNYYNNTLIIEKIDGEFSYEAFYEEISSTSANVTDSADSSFIQLATYGYSYDGEYLIKPNRLLLDEDFEVLSNSNFAKSNINSPTSRIQQDFLKVELPENSMISIIQLKYIKKPLLINLFLNRNTDIGTESIDIIARKTAETISKIKSNNNAQYVERANLFNE